MSSKHYSGRQSSRRVYLLGARLALFYVFLYLWALPTERLVHGLGRDGDVATFWMTSGLLVAVLCSIVQGELAVLDSKQ